MSSSSPLYAAVWRWHGIAGLIVAPLLLTSALTGGIYLFQEEVDRLQYPALFAPPTPGATSLSQQTTAAVALLPGSTFVKIRMAPTLDRPNEVLLREANGEETTVVIDPGTGKARGKLAEATRVTNIAFHIHSDLYAGFPGRVLLELGACWGLVLIVTGYFLWWPRAGTGWLSALTPRLGAPGIRRWRDLHVVPAAFLALPAAMLIITGLPWTAVWGKVFSSAADAMHSGFSSEVFWWRPESNEAANAPRLSIDQIWQTVQSRSFPSVVEVCAPRKPNEAWLVRGTMGRDPALTRYTFVDPASGKILAEKDWKDIGAMQKPVSYGVSLHMGLLFGNANRLLSLSGVIGVILMTITAPILWWKRRAHRTTIFPPPSDVRLMPRWLKVGTVAAMCLLPVAGISLVLVLTVGWLRDRRQAPQRL